MERPVRSNDTGPPFRRSAPPLARRSFQRLRSRFNSPVLARLDHGGEVAAGAAADYLGNGAIEINKYETEIYDIIRRTSACKSCRNWRRRQSPCARE